MNFTTADSIVFIGYILIIVGFGFWIAQRSSNDTPKDYFLASGALPWWAVGGSLIASNISTEQILGMNGSGYVMGMAIAAYELMAALTLLLVAKFFIPVFIKNGIYTMPQFLEKRYDSTVKTIMAFFWLALFIFINITSIFYLGGLAIHTLTGYSIISGIIFLSLYSAVFSIFGGLKAVVWTDVVQVVVLVVGGLVAAYSVLDAVSGGGGFLGGMNTLLEEAPEKFNMILEKGHPSYLDLPGISVLIGGLWIANIYYWGNNQYIIQRALAAKSIGEAQKGVAFAALLKLLMPLIVVIPGIAAFVMQADIDKPDQAFPWVLSNYVGSGFRGLVFAALVAAIGSSISSMVNSVSTIFTLDIYKPLISPHKGDKHYVNIGKITAAVALLIGVILAPLLGNLNQVFQYIQEYTTFISPGVVAVFILGIFWKRATSRAALAAILVSVPLSFFLKEFFPALPFIDRAAFTFLFIVAMMVVISLLGTAKNGQTRIKDSQFRWIVIGFIVLISLPSGVKFAFENGDVPAWFGYLIIVACLSLVVTLLRERNADNHKELIVDSTLFKTDRIFNISTFVVSLILALIYTMFW
ncbi:MAG: sodium/solute symporter [Saprospiraceae bacterium]